MMASRGENPRELAELSALADGSLDPARREEVQARINASPELSALYERERRVVQLLQASNAEVRAPAALRARIDAERPSRAVRTRRRVVFGGSLAAGLAAVALALVLLLPGGAPGAPSVSQAASLAWLGSTAPPPPLDPDNPIKLGRNIQQVYFPNWRPFGWRASGQRTDRINGRNAATVYYRHGEEIAYTIVASPTLEAPVAEVSVLKGTVLRTVRMDGRLVVTWQRDGHTCVLSGVGVPASTLQRLAAYEVPGLNTRS
jgi:anti-sigma factor RsiW